MGNRVSSAEEAVTSQRINSGSSRVVPQRPSSPLDDNASSSGSGSGGGTAGSSSSRSRTVTDGGGGSLSFFTSGNFKRHAVATSSGRSRKGSAAAAVAAAQKRQISSPILSTQRMSMTNNSLNLDSYNDTNTINNSSMEPNLIDFTTEDPPEGSLMSFDLAESCANESTTTVSGGEKKGGGGGGGSCDTSSYISSN